MYRPEAKVDAAGSLGAGAAPSRSRCGWVGSRRADPGRPQAKEILLGIQPAAFMAGMQTGGRRNIRNGHGEWTLETDAVDAPPLPAVHRAEGHLSEMAVSWRDRIASDAEGRITALGGGG